MSNHYEVLGVPRNASSKEVKKAYERKVRALAGPAPQRAVQERILKDALDVLTNPAKRTTYDSRLGDSLPPPASAGSGTALIIGLAVVALTAAGVGFFLHERSKDRAQMRMDERRAAEEREKARATTPAPVPQNSGKR